MKKTIKTALLIFLLICTLKYMGTMGACCETINGTSVIDNSQTKCVIVLGDSRTCGIIIDLQKDTSWEPLYLYSKDTSYEAVFKKGNIMLVLCARAGAKIVDETYEDCMECMYKLLGTESHIQGCKSYSFFNYFGINDCVFTSEHEKYPPMYVYYDQVIYEKLGYLNKVYQINCGPIDPNGSLNKMMPGINSGVKAYNKFFKRDGNVRILDLYSYLSKNGYATNDIIDDKKNNMPSGLHYDTATNMKVLNYIISNA